MSIADILALSILLAARAAFAGEMPVDGVTAKEPFWKTPAVYKTITDKRELAVSAKIEKSEKEGKGLERLQVVAAGQVSVPLEYAWKKVRDFERLPKISSHFNKAVYYPDAKRLYIEVEAIGYHAHLMLSLEYKDVASDWKEIRWEVVDYSFIGMRGTIRLEDYKGSKTEMSLFSEHETKKLPLPPPLKALVIEVVSQRVAGLFRQYIESEYKKERKK
ncbi:MAG: hypothetical protein ABL958_11340 [Bdellovibrionia bacterium]